MKKRLEAAAAGDFVIVLYNPSSHKRKDYLMRACDILLRRIEEERICGYVENIGREGTEGRYLYLKAVKREGSKYVYHGIYWKFRLGEHKWEICHKERL